MKTLRIGFLSPQGGSGLTTLLVCMASRLHYHHRRPVAVVDCDEEKHSCLSMRLREDASDSFGGPYPITASDPASCLKDAAAFAGSVEIVLFDLGRCRNILLPLELDLVYVPLVKDHMLGYGLERMRDMASLALKMRRHDGTRSSVIFRVFLNKCRKEDVTLASDLFTEVSSRPPERQFSLTDRKVFWRKAFESNMHLGKAPVSTLRPPNQPFMKHSSLYSLESMILCDIATVKFRQELQSKR